MGEIFILNTTFESNNAISTSFINFGGLGGALYISSAEQNKPSYNIAGCSFISNSATTYGGAIYSIGVPPTFGDDNIFVDNIILESKQINHFGSHAVQLAIIQSDDVANFKETPEIEVNTNSKSLLLENVTTSVTYRGKYYIALLDIYG